MRTCKNHALLSSRPPPLLHAQAPDSAARKSLRPAFRHRWGEGEEPLVRGPGAGSKGLGAQPGPPFRETWCQGATPRARASQHQPVWCYLLPPNVAGDRGHRRSQGRQGPQKRQEAGMFFKEKL